jgi:hypothetical protein
MYYAFSSSHHFGPRHFVLFVRWCDAHSTGTRKRAILEAHPTPFRALNSEENCLPGFAIRYFGVQVGMWRRPGRYRLPGCISDLGGALSGEDTPGRARALLVPGSSSIGLIGHLCLPPAAFPSARRSRSLFGSDWLASAASQEPSPIAPPLGRIPLQKVHGGGSWAGGRRGCRSRRVNPPRAGYSRGCS